MRLAADKSANRYWSGCNVSYHPGTDKATVAWIDPFSQLFVDIYGGVDDLQCGEWPMAYTEQQPYGTPGRLPNIIPSHNSWSRECK
jgi:hypothetical protein